VIKKVVRFYKKDGSDWHTFLIVASPSPLGEGAGIATVMAFGEDKVKTNHPVKRGGEEAAMRAAMDHLNGLFSQNEFSVMQENA
jgi:hypothetical protein